MTQRLPQVLVAAFMAVALVIVTAIIAVLVRNPIDGPLAARMPDWSFSVFGVTQLVEWEGRRLPARTLHPEHELGNGERVKIESKESIFWLVAEADEKKGDEGREAPAGESGGGEAP